MIIPDRTTGKEGDKETLRKLIGPKVTSGKLRSRNEVYRNIRTPQTSEDMRHERAGLTCHVLKIDKNRMMRRVWKTMKGTIGKKDGKQVGC